MNTAKRMLVSKIPTYANTWARIQRNWYIHTIISQKVLLNFIVKESSIKSRTSDGPLN